MNQKGITRIEILVIALVVGLLGIMAIVAVSSARSRTRDAIRLSDIRQIQAGLELYFNDHSEYPQANGIPLGTASTYCLGGSGFAASCSGSIETVYLEAIAATPDKGLDQLSSCGAEDDAYCYLGVDGEYRLQFELERANQLLGLSKGINCATEYGLERGTCPPVESEMSTESTESESE